MEIDEGVELSSDGSSAKEDNEMEEDVTPPPSDKEEVDGGIVSPRSASGQVKGDRGRNERVLSAGEVRAHLRLLFAKVPVITNLLYGRHGSPSGSKLSSSSSVMADMFFMDVVPVTPTRFRPASKMGDELFENAQNSLLSAVITTCKRIQDLNQQLHDQARAEKGEMVLDSIAKGRGFEDVRIDVGSVDQAATRRQLFHG